MPSKWNEEKQRWYSEPYSPGQVHQHGQEIQALEAEGLTKKQIAAELGVSVATIYQRLKRAKDQPLSVSWSIEGLDRALVRRRALESEGLEGEALERELANLA